MKRAIFLGALLAAGIAQAYDFGSLLNQAGKVVDTAKQVVQDNSAGEETRVGRSTAATLLGAAPLWQNAPANSTYEPIGSRPRGS